MMKRYYEFAGIQAEISVPDEWMCREERILKPFAIEETECPHHFRYDIVDELPEPKGKIIAKTPSYRVYAEENEKNARLSYIGSVEQSWKNAYMCVQHMGKEHQVQVKRDQTIKCITNKIILNTLNIEQLLLEKDSFILHASYIVWNGKGILFTAPSGTGKSTQAELWKQYREAEIINGDRAVVRFTPDGSLACGLPYAGSSEYCLNRTVPLCAIVYLEQGRTNEIQPLKGLEAFRKLWEQITVPLWDKNGVDKISDLLQHVIKEVPIYHLTCTPDESAVLTLENELSKLNLIK